MMEIGNAVRRAGVRRGEVAPGRVGRRGRRDRALRSEDGAGHPHGAGLQVADGEAAVTFLEGPSGCKRCAGPVVDPWA